MMLQMKAKEAHRKRMERQSSDAQERETKLLKAAEELLREKLGDEFEIPMHSTYVDVNSGTVLTTIDGVKLILEPYAWILSADIAGSVLHIESLASLGYFLAEAEKQQPVKEQKAA